MKKLYRGILIGLLSLCGAFFVACNDGDDTSETGLTKIIDNTKTAEITILEDTSNEDVTITVNTNNLTYAEAKGNPATGMKITNSEGRKLKVVSLTNLEDETGKIVYGQKTVEYEITADDGKTVKFSRKIVVTETNRPTFAAQSCDLFQVNTEYEYREDYGIDLGYTELEAITYSGSVLTEDNYTVSVVNESVVMSPKAVFINGAFLQQLGVGTHTFEVVTNFGYNNYVLTVTDNEKAAYTFDSELDQEYIITDPAYVLPTVINAETSYQVFEAKYSLLYGGKIVDSISQEGKYIYRVTVMKTGFEDEVKDYSFYYLSEKNKEVFIDPVISAQYMNQYTVDSSRSTLTFVNEGDRPYYLHTVKNAYNRNLNKFAIDPEVLRKSIESGMTSLSVDVKVAEESALDSVAVLFYTTGDVIWQSSKTTITKDGWTTISIDLKGIQHWQDSTLKGFSVDENGKVTMQITAFCITTQYGDGETGGEANVNYALMYSNIRMSESNEILNGDFVSEDGNSSIKFENGMATLMKNGAAEKVLYVSIYANGLVKFSESKNYIDIIGSSYSVSYEDGQLICNGIVYKAETGAEDNPYVYDIYG